MYQAKIFYLFGAIIAFLIFLGSLLFIEVNDLLAMSAVIASMLMSYFISKLCNLPHK